MPRLRAEVVDEQGVIGKVIEGNISIGDTFISATRNFGLDGESWPMMAKVKSIMVYGEDRGIIETNMTGYLELHGRVDVAVGDVLLVNDAEVV